jgi:hypothetical protein
MKRRKHRSKPMQIMHLWTWSDAVKAVPYLRSVIGSLREHWLEVLRSKRQLERATQQKSAAKRQQLLEQEKQEDDLHRAQTQFNDALEELTRIDVFLLEPVRGVALIPFRQADDLAWFVFDLFAKDGLVGWRFHNDPMDECRALSLLNEPAAKDVPAPLAS